MEKCSRRVMTSASVDELWEAHRRYNASLYDYPGIDTTWLRECLAFAEAGDYENAKRCLKIAIDAPVEPTSDTSDDDDDDPILDVYPIIDESYTH